MQSNPDLFSCEQYIYIGMFGQFGRDHILLYNYDDPWNLRFSDDDPTLPAIM